jgi:2-keto-4-pentenoate hydratase/2-oxohepta-3-ene-1,7-dioic acid hydratase in catechol pathway
MTTSPNATPFSLGTFSTDRRPSFAGLVLADQRVVAIQDLAEVARDLGIAMPNASSTLALLEDWHSAMPALQHLADALTQGSTSSAQDALGGATAMNAVKVHPPVASRQIFMAGANYFKHVVDLFVDGGPGKFPGTEGMAPQDLRAFVEEMMHRRRREGVPYVFSKPFSAMTGAFDPIEIPSYAAQPDWELELAVIIGAPARHVSRSNAMQHVAGYTIANDITNRDWVMERGDMKAIGSNWLVSKSCPGYLPVGPTLVPAAHVKDPAKLQLQLKLNGDLKQNENTSDMIFDIARLIEYTSSIVQLLPGDVLCTGSPAGNGTHYNRFLQAGDVVEATITGLGMQRNPVVAGR